jgi:ribosomal protein L23
MQLAIQLAQQELQTQQAMLAYYQKKEKEYLEYIEEVGTAGAGRSGGRVTDKQFERQLAALKLKQSVIQDAEKRELQIIKFVEEEYTVPVGSVGSINNQARQAALNLSTSMTNTNAAIKGTTGFKKGTPGAMAAAITFYGEMEAQANLAGRGTQFNANKTAIKQAIISHFGVGGFSHQGKSASDMLSGTGFEDMKQARVQALKVSTGGQALSNKELRDIEQKAGLQPGTLQQGTTQQTSQTAQEQEDFLASRLKEVQSKMSTLEDQILQRSNAEDLMKRARQIYSKEFVMNKTRKKGKRAKDALRNVTPEQMFYIDSLQSVAGNPIDVSIFVPSEDNKDTVEAKAYQLMNAIIKNKGSGKSINVAKLAAEMDPKKAELITGLAIKGFLEYEKRDDPIKAKAEQQDEAVNKAAVDEAIGENQEEKDALTEQFKAEQEEEKKLKALIEGLETDGTINMEGVPAFKSMEEVEAFLSSPDRDPLTRQKVIDILGEERLADSPTSKYSVSAQSIANIQNAQIEEPLGPVEGEIYKRGKDNYGYKVVPGGVQFVFKDGRIKSTIFGPDSAQYKEMLEFYEKSKK